MAKQKVLVVIGPTSSGKSALAVQLARKFSGEIISADSRQVYRGLDIGTGKITKREMRGVPHHLLDVASPKKVFTAHDFVTRGRTRIGLIYQTGKLPIIAGGTGFYIDALLGRVTLADVSANQAFRRLHNKSTAGQLLCMLKKLHPVRAKTIDPHNKRRLVRALEIAAALGKNPRVTAKSPYDVYWIGLTLPKETLLKKIHTRLLARLKGGMVAEAQRLHAQGLSYKRMEALGLEYRSFARLLQKKISQQELIEELELAIWHYAKRQLTYWRRNKEIRWFAPSEKKEIETAVRSWLKR